MHVIGHIRQLQVQIDALKTGEGSGRRYDTAALRLVTAARLSSEGVVGLQGGRELLDVHHSRHRRSRNKESNAISFNFIPHYEQMRDRFGPNLALGCGGENLLIALNEGLVLEDSLEIAALTLLVETRDSHRGSLTNIKVARPCVPFSEFVLDMDGKPPAEVTKEAIQFLDEGMRGYYCAWEGEPLVVQPGDKVLVQE